MTSPSERDWVARTGCWSHAERVLLTYEQVHASQLPATEGKRGDPRWPAFARRHGFDSDARCCGRWRRWSRPNSGAWSSPPSTVTSSPGRSPSEEEQRRALAAFLDGWDAAGGGAPS
ncbi:hypothetical protein EDD94_5567 [Streptomyces sp. PanSC9]|nr:hypothetical protein EDD94_5567 [Streptomyces sp. PanSC9]